MSTGVERAFWICALSAASTLVACGDSGPTSLTGSSDVPPGEAAAQDLSVGQASALSALHEGLEDFDCTHVENVRVRFSTPGYVEDDEAGLYVHFTGLPEGPKRLRIWWDYVNDAVHFRDFVFPEQDREIEQLYEHRYLDLPGPTEMLVRVELIRDGLTGNCPRNRRVLVAPPVASAPSSPSGPTTQTASVGPGIGSVTGYDWTYVEGVRFTVLTPLTINSVAVDPGAGGTLGISLWDSSGSTLLSSRTMAVGSGPQQVALGFSLAPGDYILTLDGTTIGAPGVGATIGGASYPYQIPGVISLTDSAFGFGTFFGYYFFLYDWQVTW
jgi:hypothetical protein